MSDDVEEVMKCYCPVCGEWMGRSLICWKCAAKDNEVDDD
jgi:hypothetical protein